MEIGFVVIVFRHAGTIGNCRVTQENPVKPEMPRAYKTFGTTESSAIVVTVAPVTAPVCVAFACATVA